MLANGSTRILNDPGLELSRTTQAMAWGTVSGIEVALHIIAITLVRAVTALQTDTAAALGDAGVTDLPES